MDVHHSFRERGVPPRSPAQFLPGPVPICRESPALPFLEHFVRTHLSIVLLDDQGSFSASAP